MLHAAVFVCRGRERLAGGGVFIAAAVGKRI